VPDKNNIVFSCHSVNSSKRPSIFGLISFENRIFLFFVHNGGVFYLENKYLLVKISPKIQKIFLLLLNYPRNLKIIYQ